MKKRYKQLLTYIKVSVHVRVVLAVGKRKVVFAHVSVHVSEYTHVHV